jgi:hypothetical protein
MHSNYSRPVRELDYKVHSDSDESDGQREGIGSTLRIKAVIRVRVTVAQILYYD